MPNTRGDRGGRYDAFVLLSGGPDSITLGNPEKDFPILVKYDRSLARVSR